MNSLPKYNLARISASAAILAVPGIVRAVLLVGGSAATTLSITNDADGNGTPVISVAAPIGDSIFMDFDTLGGVRFTSKIYGKLAGAGGVAYVWYE